MARHRHRDQQEMVTCYMFDIIRISIARKCILYKAKSNKQTCGCHNKRRERLIRLYSSWDTSMLRDRYQQLVKKGRRLTNNDVEYAIACLLATIFVLIGLTYIGQHIFSNMCVIGTTTIIGSIAFFFWSLHYLSQALPKRIKMEIYCIMAAL